MKKKILKTIRNIFDGVMIFLLILTTTVYALPSDGVTYDNSTSGSSATNVKDALNDLYSKLNQKQEEINNINNIGNAGANHILNGYTAYVKGSTVIGSIPSKEVTTYTPGIKDQTIDVGNYISGIQTIKGDENLVAANIAKGKSIFGVNGTYTSDANATASTILNGYTAYVNGKKITGTASGLTSLNLKSLAAYPYQDTTKRERKYTCTSSYTYYIATSAITDGITSNNTSEVIFETIKMGQGSYGYKIWLLKAKSGDVIAIKGRTVDIYGLI